MARSVCVTRVIIIIIIVIIHVSDCTLENNLGTLISRGYLHDDVILLL